MTVLARDRADAVVHLPGGDVLPRPDGMQRGHDVGRRHPIDACRRGAGRRSRGGSNATGPPSCRPAVTPRCRRRRPWSPPPRRSARPGCAAGRGSSGRRPRGPASVGKRSGTGLGQRDQAIAAEAQGPGPALHHQPLHPPPGPRGVHVQVEPVPVTVATGRATLRQKASVMALSGACPCASWPSASSGAFAISAGMTTPSGFWRAVGGGRSPGQRPCGEAAVYGLKGPAPPRFSPASRSSLRVQERSRMPFRARSSSVVRFGSHSRDTRSSRRKARGNSTQLTRYGCDRRMPKSACFVIPAGFFPGCSAKGRFST